MRSGTATCKPRGEEYSGSIQDPDNGTLDCTRGSTQNNIKKQRGVDDGSKAQLHTVTVLLIAE